MIPVATARTLAEGHRDSHWLTKGILGWSLPAAALALLIGLAPAFAQETAAGDTAPETAGETAPETPSEGSDGERIIRAHGYSFYGDLSYPPDFPHYRYVNPEAPRGGDISVWAPGTFDSLNPYSRLGRAGQYSSAMYESLLDGGPFGDSAPADAYGEYYGLLAESLEYPESKDWVIFHMRPEARFSDGTPVTAHDVVFSHNLFLEQGLPSYAQAVSYIVTGAEALDDHTVRFTFREGISRRSLIDQVGSTPVFSRAWYDETGARLDESRLITSPGSGPYLLDSYEINRRITYRRNPDYWGWNLPNNIGRHNFDRIRVEYFGDDTAAFEAFKGGEYTLRPESNSRTWATGYDFPAVARGWVVQEAIPDGTPPTPTGFVFNLRRPALQDIRVREALSLAYNFEFTNAQFQYGLMSQRSSYTQGTRLEAQGLPEGAERALLESLGDLVPAALLDQPAFTAHVSSAQTLNDRDNSRRAGLLLDEAGWTIDTNRTTDAVKYLPLGLAALGLALVLALGLRFAGLRGGKLAIGALGGAAVLSAGLVVALPGVFRQSNPNFGLRVNAEGQPLRLEFPYASSSSDTLVSIIDTLSQNLRRLGVDLRTQRIDPAQYTARSRDFDYDLIYSGYSAFLDAGTGLRQRYGSEDAGDVFNPAGLQSPLVDAIIDNALMAPNPQARDAALMALDRALRAERIMIPTWYVAESWYAYWDVYDHPAELPQFGDGPLDFWWYDSEAAARLRAAGAPAAALAGAPR